MLVCSGTRYNEIEDDIGCLTVTLLGSHLQRKVVLAHLPKIGLHLFRCFGNVSLVVGGSDSLDCITAGF